MLPTTDVIVKYLGMLSHSANRITDLKEVSTFSEI